VLTEGPLRNAIRHRTREGFGDAGQGLSNVAIGKILGVDEGTIRNDLASEHSKARQRKSDNNKVGTELPSEHSEPQPSAVAESVARARAAVVAVLPVLGAGARLEFHARALTLAEAVRRSRDGEALRLAEGLLDELAGVRSIPPRS
jgi:hypothetical protein